MKTILYLTSIVFLGISCQNTPQQQVPNNMIGNEHRHDAHSFNNDEYIRNINRGVIVKDTLKGSPQRMAMGNIGQAHVHINYHSPGVKERIIWGGLVPYDQVWVTGAHNATNISFSRDIKIANKRIPAGTYAIYTIPGASEWTFILNKNYKQHLADDYDEAEDIIRTNITPTETNFTPRLTYHIEEEGEKGGIISMAWEMLKIKIPFTVE